MLPGVDGFTVLSAFRTAKQTPVLMLNARALVDDKVKGFDLCADDYLINPFEFPEILGRVRALLKRGVGQSVPDIHRFEDLEIEKVCFISPTGAQDGRGVVANADCVNGVGH